MKQRLSEIECEIIDWISRVFNKDKIEAFYFLISFSNFNIHRFKIMYFQLKTSPRYDAENVYIMKIMFILDL